MAKVATQAAAEHCIDRYLLQYGAFLCARSGDKAWAR
jgi:hypothetical protein